MLDVANNPLSFPPRSVCARGLRAILDALAVPSPEHTDARSSILDRVDDSPVKTQPLSFREGFENDLDTLMQEKIVEI